jgi:hypothetical protein
MGGLRNSKSLIALIVLLCCLTEAALGQAVTIRKADLDKVLISAGVFQLRLKRLGPKGVFRYRKIRIDVENTSNAFQISPLRSFPWLMTALKSPFGSRNITVKAAGPRSFTG